MQATRSLTVPTLAVESVLIYCYSTRFADQDKRSSHSDRAHLCFTLSSLKKLLELTARLPYAHMRLLTPARHASYLDSLIYSISSTLQPNRTQILC